jgi:hypothetical protein
MEDRSSVRIRKARYCDAEQLARLHFICSSTQPGAFMHRLGQRFFVKYYQIILKEKTTTILLADEGKNRIVGFVSATLDSKKHLEAIREGWFKLFLAVFPCFIREPSLIRAMHIRNKFLSGRFLGEGFIINSGARIIYWGWLPDCPSKGRSTYLLKELLCYMEGLGAHSIQLEVDRINKKVEIMHRVLGAKIVKEFTTRDDRERVVMEYKLNPKQSDSGLR